MSKMKKKMLRQQWRIYGEINQLILTVYLPPIFLESGVSVKEGKQPTKLCCVAHFVT